MTANSTKSLSDSQVHELIRLLAGPSPRGDRNVAIESLQRKGLVLRLAQFDQLTDAGRAIAESYPFAIGCEWNKGRYVWGAYKTLAAAQRAYQRLTSGTGVFPVGSLPVWCYVGTSAEVSDTVRGTNSGHTSSGAIE